MAGMREPAGSRRANGIESGIALRHTLFDDAYALVMGCSFLILGLIFLKSASLVTGGIAGLALLGSYFVPLPAGFLFTLLNIPFFLAVGGALGRPANFKAILPNLLISAFALAAPLMFRLDAVNALFAALFGGTMLGAGILLLARHKVGVGGIGILALALEKSRGWNVGRTQFAADALILMAALPVLGMGLERFALSLLSAVATAGVLMTFHKPGRYTGY
jgi:uncharacterized membrane-anchored protein YitT (DUF2179 family)